MSLFESDPSRPLLRQEPLEIAPETFLIRAATASGGASSTNLNSMVIRGKEPVLVDAGMITHRDTWFKDVFSLVEPEDVRWIYLTHDDSDHAGNFVAALERCPNATVITSRAGSFRTAAAFGISLARIRTVDDAQSFDAGDRTLHAIRPPVYDSPYTRGLFDSRTRVYYASDAFCSPMPNGPVDEVAEIPPALWAEGMARFHHYSLCPWIALVDQTRFQAEVRKLAGIGIDVITGAHTAVIRGAAVAQAYEHMAKLPTTNPGPMILPETGSRPTA